MKLKSKEQFKFGYFRHYLTGFSGRNPSPKLDYEIQSLEKLFATPGYNTECKVVIKALLE